TGEHVDYAPYAVKLVGLTPAKAEQLSHARSQDTDRIHLYSDATAPTRSPADWDAYQRRLQLLATLELAYGAVPGGDGGHRVRRRGTAAAWRGPSGLRRRDSGRGCSRGGERGAATRRHGRRPPWRAPADGPRGGRCAPRPGDARRPWDGGGG